MDIGSRNTSVDAFDDAITDGPIEVALSTCRTLFKSSDSSKKLDTAHLILERLKTKEDDRPDDVNTLLRLLANAVPPTPELTSDALSLLFISEHREVVIHHLSRMTYLSPTCVKLVVEAYLELLASDRALLVPILGSLADLPLDTPDKKAVMDATQDRLTAAAEEDMPTVVQSLLSMATSASASSIVSKLRDECNRINSGTLSLAFEVIARFAIKGSVPLNAFLRTIRHADPLTTFDILFLTMLMGKSIENERAIRVATFIAQQGRFQQQVVIDTANILIQPEWSSLLPSFVRFCSFLIGVSFEANIKQALATGLISMATDALIKLIDCRSTAHDDALTLLLSLSSQPQKLVLLSNTTSKSSAFSLSWHVAQIVVKRLAALSETNPKTLAPYAHLFLDHLHTIASGVHNSTGSSEGGYPPIILDLLCQTMVALTAHERGVYSLLMITIQKQSLLPKPSARMTSGQRQSSVKQLMAVFLAGHVLQHTALGEERDRHMLVSWLLRLLTAASAEDTLLHVLRLVRRGLAPTSAYVDTPGFLRNVTTSEQRSQCTSLVADVFRAKGLVWKPRDLYQETSHRGPKSQQSVQDVDRSSQDVVTAFDASDGDSSNGERLVADVAAFTLKMQLGGASSHLSNDSFEGSRSDLSTLQRSIERTVLHKLALFRELYKSSLAFSSLQQQDAMLDSGFVLPKEYKSLDTSDGCAAVAPADLNRLIWSLICALDVAVATVNSLGRTVLRTSTQNEPEQKVARERLWKRLRTCLALHEQLVTALIVHRGQLSKSSRNTSTSMSQDEETWLSSHLQTAEKLLRGELYSAETAVIHGSLFSIDLFVVCLVLESMWEGTGDVELTFSQELALLQVLRKYVKAGLTVEATYMSVASDQLQSNGALYGILARKSGRRMLKYLTFRANELSAYVRERQETQDGDMDPEEEADDKTLQSMNQEMATRTLNCIYQLIIVLLDKSREGKSPMSSANADRVGPVEDDIVKLLARGTRSALKGKEQSSRECREVLYRFLEHQSLMTWDPRLACGITEVLAVLCLYTRRQRAVGQLCIALLRQPFPATESFEPDMYDAGDMSSSGVSSIAVRLLPDSITSLERGTSCSLSYFRCQSADMSYISFLIISSYVLPTSTLDGLFILDEYTQAMQSLVQAAASETESKTGASVEQKRRKIVASDGSTNALPDEQGGSVVREGEHTILKTLTNETLPIFLETIFVCAVASLHRAAIHRPKQDDKKKSSRTSPFATWEAAILVIRNCLSVYVEAEESGFDLPNKTNMLVLRGGILIVQALKPMLKKCVNWRSSTKEQDSQATEITHLSTLFSIGQSLVNTFEHLSQTYQERATLRMQHSFTKSTSADPSTPDGKRPARGRWNNELMAKVYGKTHHKRRAVSATEAKLIPRLSHAIEVLQDFIHSNDEIYSLGVKDTSTQPGTLLSSLYPESHHYSRSMENESEALQEWAPLDLVSAYEDENDQDAIGNDRGNDEDDVEILGSDSDDDLSHLDQIDGFGVSRSTDVQGHAQSSASDLQRNEELGFSSVVINFKKHQQKKTNK